MELRAYISVLQRRWKLTLLIFSIALFLSIFGGTLYSPSYQAETRLRVIPPLGGSLENPYYQTTFATRLMNTYAQIASSELILNQLRENLGLETLPDISVTIIPDSEIIQIIASSSDPSLAAKAANGLAELVISTDETAIESSAISNGLSIFTRRIEELKAELEVANQKHDELVLNYSNAAAQVAALDREIQMKETTYQNLALALGTINPEVTRLENEINTKNQEFQELSTKANEYSEQISLLRQTIQNKESAYTNLVLRYDTVQVTNLVQISTQNVQIVSPAIEPSKPTGFGRIFIVGLGVICGLVGSVIFAFVIDNLDTRLFTPENTKDVLDKPIIGNISEIHDLNKRNVHLQSDPPTIHRDIWILCTKILGFLRDGSIKTILVTSANPGEGKSTIISGIATVLAQNNCKVLIIDADVHKPQQHQLFNVSNEQSLNAFLKGKKNTLHGVVLENVRPDIDLLPCEIESGNPMELFQSPQFNVLLEQVQKYDLVLFDTPSVQTAPDAYRLAMALDGVIVIMQKGRTTRNDIQSLSTYMELVGSNFLGVVMNQAPFTIKLSPYQSIKNNISKIFRKEQKVQED